MKVLWLSRHQLSADQVADLSVTLGFTVEVTTVNMTFPARSADAVRAIVEASKGFDIVCGVFPAHIAAAMQRESAYPVGEMAMLHSGIDLTRPMSTALHAWTPVSMPVFAEDGTPRGFNHSHWECLTN